MDDVLDCYGILGVSTDASPAEIQQAYDYANEFFGSANYKGDRDYAEKFLSDAQKAYITLSDPRFRYVFDEYCGITKRYEGVRIPHLDPDIIYPGYKETGDLYQDKLALFTIPKIEGYKEGVDYSYLPFPGCFGLEQNEIPKVREQYEAEAKRCEALVKNALEKKKEYESIFERAKYSKVLEKLQQGCLIVGGVGAVLFVIWLILRMFSIADSNFIYTGFPQSCISAAIIGFGAAAINPIGKDLKIIRQCEDADHKVEEVTLDKKMIGYLQYVCALQEYDNYCAEVNNKA